MANSLKATERASRLAVISLAVGLAVPAQAVTFNWGNIEGSFTSTFSVGASWRTEDPDEDYLSPGNTGGEGRSIGRINGLLKVDTLADSIDWAC